MKDLKSRTLDELTEKVEQARAEGYVVIGNDVFKSKEDGKYHVIMDLKVESQETSSVWTLGEYIEAFGLIAIRITKKGTQMVTIQLPNGEYKEMQYRNDINLYDVHLKKII